MKAEGWRTCEHRSPASRGVAIDVTIAVQATAKPVRSKLSTLRAKSVPDIHTGRCSSEGRDRCSSILAPAGSCGQLASFDRRAGNTRALYPVTPPHRPSGFREPFFLKVDLIEEQIVVVRCQSASGWPEREVGHAQPAARTRSGWNSAVCQTMGAPQSWPWHGIFGVQGVDHPEQSCMSWSWRRPQPVRGDRCAIAAHVDGADAVTGSRKQLHLARQPAPDRPAVDQHQQRVALARDQGAQRHAVGWYWSGA